MEASEKHTKVMEAIKDYLIGLSHLGGIGPAVLGSNEPYEAAEARSPVAYPSGKYTGTGAAGIALLTSGVGAPMAAGLGIGAGKVGEEYFSKTKKKIDKEKTEDIE